MKGIQSPRDFVSADDFNELVAESFGTGCRTKGCKLQARNMCSRRAWTEQACWKHTSGTCLDQLLSNNKQTPGEAVVATVVVQGLTVVQGKLVCVPVLFWETL